MLCCFDALHVYVVFLGGNFQGGGKPMFREIEGGHRLELKDINCEN